jgi:hypothetical protein
MRASAYVVKGSAAGIARFYRDFTQIVAGTPYRGYHSPLKERHHGDMQKLSQATAAWNR